MYGVNNTTCITWYTTCGVIIAISLLSIFGLLFKPEEHLFEQVPKEVHAAISNRNLEEVLVKPSTVNADNWQYFAENMEQATSLGYRLDTSWTYDRLSLFAWRPNAPVLEMAFEGLETPSWFQGLDRIAVSNDGLIGVYKLSMPATFWTILAVWIIVATALWPFIARMIYKRNGGKDWNWGIPWNT